MKLLYTALAVTLVVSSAGCQAFGPRGGCNSGCCDPYPVTQSQRAPRPLLGRHAATPTAGMLDVPASDGCGPGQGLCGGRCDPAGHALVNGAVGAIAGGGCTPQDQFYGFNPGPPTGQVAYPYYTVRGPRDYLRDNPPSIGPY